MTDYLRPESLTEALAARRDHPGHVLLAGGTDLMVLGEKRPTPAGVIDLFRLPELRGITRAHDAVRIGAGVTYSELLASADVTEPFPMLAQVAREVGAVQIQNRGTLGGNLGTSSPVGDTLPVLLALDAELELASVGGTRRVAYHGFCTGYRKTALAPDELIVAVHLPLPREGVRQHYRKVGTRRAQAISKALVAASLGFDAEGRIDGARIAVGAMAATPLRLEGVEALCVGQPPSPGLAGRVRAGVAEALTPIDDVRSTAAYRLEVVANVLAGWVASPVA